MFAWGIMKQMLFAKEKIYSYVDESGQDTAGEIFLVSVVLVEDQRDELRYKKMDKDHQKTACRIY